MQRVAIAVVDGHADETPRDLPFGQAAVHFVEADEVEVRAVQVAHHVLEKARRHFQQSVRLKPVGPRRTHVMKREDRADAGHEWPHESGRR